MNDTKSAPKTRGSVFLELSPTQLMQVFYVPTVEVDCGKPRDIVDTACKAYLLWVSEYPDYVPSLYIVGNPEMQRALNRALFRRKRSKQ